MTCVGHGTASRAQTFGLEVAFEALRLANWAAANAMCVRRSSGRRKSGAPYLRTAQGDVGNVNSLAATTCTWRVRRGSMLTDAELQDTQPAAPRSALSFYCWEFRLTLNVIARILRKVVNRVKLGDQHAQRGSRSEVQSRVVRRRDRFRDRDKDRHRHRDRDIDRDRDRHRLA